MSDLWPTMMYRKGTESNLHGFDVDTMVVNDEAEELAAAADGWFHSPAQAYGAKGPETVTLASLKETDHLRTDLAAAQALIEEQEATIKDLRDRLARVEEQSTKRRAKEAETA
jgi:hypothetical protein